MYRDFLVTALLTLAVIKAFKGMPLGSEDRFAGRITTSGPKPAAADIPADPFMFMEYDDATPLIGTISVEDTTKTARTTTVSIFNATLGPINGLDTTTTSAMDSSKIGDTIETSDTFITTKADPPFHEPTAISTNSTIDTTTTTTEELFSPMETTTTTAVNTNPTTTTTVEVHIDSTQVVIGSKDVEISPVKVKDLFDETVVDTSRKNISTVTTTEVPDIISSTSNANAGIDTDISTTNGSISETALTEDMVTIAVMDITVVPEILPEDDTITAEATVIFESTTNTISIDIPASSATSGILKESSLSSTLGLSSSSSETTTAETFTGDITSATETSEMDDIIGVIDITTSALDITNTTSTIVNSVETATNTEDVALTEISTAAVASSTANVDTPIALDTTSNVTIPLVAKETTATNTTSALDVITTAITTADISTPVASDTLTVATITTTASDMFIIVDEFLSANATIPTGDTTDNDVITTTAEALFSAANNSDSLTDSVTDTTTEASIKFAIDEYTVAVKSTTADVTEASQISTSSDSFIASERVTGVSIKTKADDAGSFDAYSGANETSKVNIVVFDTSNVTVTKVSDDTGTFTNDEITTSKTTTASVDTIEDADETFADAPNGDDLNIFTVPVVVSTFEVDNSEITDTKVASDTIPDLGPNLQAEKMSVEHTTKITAAENVGITTATTVSETSIVIVATTTPASERSEDDTIAASTTITVVHSDDITKPSEERSEAVSTTVEDNTTRTEGTTETLVQFGGPSTYDHIFPTVKTTISTEEIDYYETSTNFTDTTAFDAVTSIDANKTVVVVLTREDGHSISEIDSSTRPTTTDTFTDVVTTDTAIAVETSPGYEGFGVTDHSKIVDRIITTATPKSSTSVPVEDISHVTATASTVDITTSVDTSTFVEIKTKVAATTGTWKSDGTDTVGDTTQNMPTSEHSVAATTTSDGRVVVGTTTAADITATLDDISTVATTTKDTHSDGINILETTATTAEVDKPIMAVSTISIVDAVTSSSSDIFLIAEEEGHVPTVASSTSREVEHSGDFTTTDASVISTASIPYYSSKPQDSTVHTDAVASTENLATATVKAFDIAAATTTVSSTFDISKNAVQFTVDDTTMTTLVDDRLPITTAVTHNADLDDILIFDAPTVGDHVTATGDTSTTDANEVLVVTSTGDTTDTNKDSTFTTSGVIKPSDIVETDLTAISDSSEVTLQRPAPSKSFRWMDLRREQYLMIPPDDYEWYREPQPPPPPPRPPPPPPHPPLLWWPPPHPPPPPPLRRLPPPPPQPPLRRLPPPQPPQPPPMWWSPFHEPIRLQPRYEIYFPDYYDELTS